MTLITIQGCVISTPEGTLVLSSYCSNYSPIYMSENDTEKTKAQIDRENRKYECACKGNCPRNVSEE